jgi:beta-catenin-like protein 1
MDAGLFTLQQSAIIIGHLWAMADTGLRKRVLGILHQKGETLEYIR